ncbi:major histocompatibility complex class I-related gene protein-like [Erythrolamprus reginae]|uniref:major histocompatibility complex class I-related gene protein-like n=1 Tax=Erythrolamprus reginae TaxID=121349 RepID=UPI00396CF277
MEQLQWRLWLMGAVIILLGNAFGTASSSHSLLHFRHVVLLEGEPQFVEVTYLDSQPIQHYDSKTKIMRPLTLWINQTLNEKYWTWESDMKYLEKPFLKKWQEFSFPEKHNQSEDYGTWISDMNIENDFLDNWQEFSLPEKHNQSEDYGTWISDMNIENDFLDNWQEFSLPEKHNQSEDHTLQCIEGCKLTTDEKEIEIHEDVIDGKEVKEEEFHRKRVYLDGSCILWLKMFLNMKPVKKELPIVKVTHQEVNINNLQTLTCQAYGFYPKEISASWRKDGGIFNETNSSLHIAPNSDGTFNARLSIQINPEEKKLYRCHMEHVSSSEPLDFLLPNTGPSAEVTSQVLNVNDTILNCSICNFYPQDIYATWMKDGENWDQETFRGDTIRNWDGTYCTWISIDINSIEEDRYCCHADHEGLQEALCVKAPIVARIEEDFQLSLVIYPAVSVLGILIFLVIIGILCCKKRRRDYRAAKKGDPNSTLDNAEKCSLKEIGVQPLQHC